MLVIIRCFINMNISIVIPTMRNSSILQMIINSNRLTFNKRF